VSDSIKFLLPELAGLDNNLTNKFKILAVSKHQSVEKIIDLVRKMGLSDFGENYLQEAIPKINQLKELKLTWHFIGPIQSNKTADIAKYFDWVHSVDRPKILDRLAYQRDPALGKLSICLQVNIDHEVTKSGTSPELLFKLVAQAQNLIEKENKPIVLKGLMAIPSQIHALGSFEDQRKPFRSLKKLFDHVKSELSPSMREDFEVLSMGMSADFKAAILEGSTLIRLGTRLFGQRG